MNYYEHHIGDYAEATGHLTFVEDAAYTRLIRKYYAQEKPLPADVKIVQRLIGARTKEEKVAVQSVLEEFFFLRDDGWHQERCDREIAEYRAGEPEREAKKSNEEMRLKRHREERARLFSLINQAGMHAPWNTTMGELRAMVGRNGLGAETVLPPLPATAPATPATATQTPDTRHQSPVTNTHTPELTSKALSGDANDSDREHVHEAPLPPREDPKEDENNPAIALAVDLRKLGVNATFTHPAVLDWAKREEVTRDILVAAVAKARETKGNAKIVPNYLVPIVEELLHPPAKTEAAAPKQREDYAWASSNQGIDAKARELGIRVLPSHSYPDVKQLCFDEIRKRKGQP